MGAVGEGYYQGGGKTKTNTTTTTKSGTSSSSKNSLSGSTAKSSDSSAYWSNNKSSGSSGSTGTSNSSGTVASSSGTSAGTSSNSLSGSTAKSSDSSAYWSSVGSSGSSAAKSSGTGSASNSSTAKNSDSSAYWSGWNYTPTTSTKTTTKTTDSATDANAAKQEQLAAQKKAQEEAAAKKAAEEEAARKKAEEEAAKKAAEEEALRKAKEYQDWLKAEEEKAELERLQKEAEEQEKYNKYIDSLISSGATKISTSKDSLSGSTAKSADSSAHYAASANTLGELNQAKKNAAEANALDSGAAENSAYLSKLADEQGGNFEYSKDTSPSIGAYWDYVNAKTSANAGESENSAHWNTDDAKDDYNTLLENAKAIDKGAQSIDSSAYKNKTYDDIMNIDEADDGGNGGGNGGDDGNDGNYINEYSTISSDGGTGDGATSLYDAGSGSISSDAITELVNQLYGDDSGIISPDVLSWAQAYAQALSTLGGSYDASLQSSLDEMKNKALQSGFFGQSNYDMMVAKAIASGELEKNSAVASLAQELVGQSKEDAQNTIENWLANKEITVDGLYDLLALIYKYNSTTTETTSGSDEDGDSYWKTTKSSTTLN